MTRLFYYLASVWLLLVAIGLLWLSAWLVVQAFATDEWSYFAGVPCAVLGALLFAVVGTVVFLEADE